MERVGHEREDLQRILATKDQLIESQRVQIAQLSAARWVSIESHSYTHGMVHGVVGR